MALSLVSHFRRRSNCPEAALQIVLSFLLEFASEWNSIPYFWHFKRDPLSVAWTKHLVVQIRVVGGAPKWVLKKCFTITLSPRIKALVMSTNEYLCSWWTMHCNQIQPNIIAFRVSQWYLSIVLSLSVNDSIVKMQWFRQFRFLRTIKG